MAQIILEHIDDATLARLSELARLNRVSVQEQAGRILTEALDMRERRRRRVESAARIAAMTPKDVAQTDSVILLREDRDR
jgi:antitoxin FitA